MADQNKRSHLGRIIVGGSLAVALITAIAVARHGSAHPRTDDATVRANYIEVAPEVSGRIVEVGVRDNQSVAQGQVLFRIDARPYEYALTQALADQAQLEKQIDDARRRIAAERSAVAAAQAGVETTRANADTAGRNVEVAGAAIEQAEAAVRAAEAQLDLAASNLRRLEPLLKKQFVTVEQVDQARAAVRVAEQRARETQAALHGTRAAQLESASRQRAAQARIFEAHARFEQSRSAVDTLDSLLAQRPAKAARVDAAQLDLERCRVVAPFDGYVTNLHLSEGAYATTGRQLFTLIDRRGWYVVANYRESELRRIGTGQSVDVYLMSHPEIRIQGVVESVGRGVFPDDGRVSDGLPVIDKTLNWVHLAARFPVRIRIVHPDAVPLRMGESAVSILR